MTDESGRRDPELTELERRLLRFEAEAPTRAGAKEAGIRERFGVSPARYYQLLHALIDLPPAVRFDPQLIGRLHRTRESRRQLRSGRRFGEPTTTVHPD